MVAAEMKFARLLLLAVACLIVPCACACDGGAPILPTRIAAISNLLNLAPTVSLTVYAETPAQDSKSRFFVYSIRPTADAVPPGTIYLAAISSAPEEKVIFTHEISEYLPAFAPVGVSGPPRSSPQPVKQPVRSFSIDACLNTFALQSSIQAVHLNLFAKSSDSEGANDIVFVLPEHKFPQPLLELNATSLYIVVNSRTRTHRDSRISVLPSLTDASEIVWEQFSTLPGAVLGASFVENTPYRWDGHGFRKLPPLAPEDLTLRLNAATPLNRSGSIHRLRGEFKMPGPNQPAP